MKSTKSQNSNPKQISITQIPNSKGDNLNPILFGSLDIGILNLFDIWLLVLVIYAGRQRWFADRRTAKFLMRLEDGNAKQYTLKLLLIKNLMIVNKVKFKKEKKNEKSYFINICVVFKLIAIARL